MNKEENLYIEESPDKLESKIGIKRINKIPILIVIGILFVFVGCIFFVLEKRSDQAPIEESEETMQTVASDASVKQLIQEQPDGIVPITNTKKPSDYSTPVTAIHSVNQIHLESQTDQEKKIKDLKLKLMKDALFSDTKASNPQMNSYSTNQPNQYSIPEFKNPLSNSLENLKASVMNQDPNKQDRKDQFLAQTKKTQYLTHTRNMPLSPYELKTGTVIPATLVSGINSDLPGQIIGQVSQHVYDTANGNHILIPQGSKLIGYYDSHVAHGQKRVLVAWHRVVFPDASTLELENMPGSDSAGHAGFEDKVNTHFWRVFGNSFLLSVMSAGFQLSQPDNANPLSPQGQLSSSMGQQFSQLGMDTARKNMDIQPTLEIRPGYRFQVMVNKDILFKEPYKL